MSGQQLAKNPKYESQPIVANFDVNVGDAAPTTISSFKELMLYYITPASIAVLIGLIIYSEIKIKKKKEKKEKAV